MSAALVRQALEFVDPDGMSSAKDCVNLSVSDVMKEVCIFQRVVAKERSVVRPVPTGTRVPRVKVIIKFQLDCVILLGATYYNRFSIATRFCTDEANLLTER